MLIPRFSSVRFHVAVSLLKSATKAVVLAACSPWLLATPTAVSAQADNRNGASCTLVLGFSQTADWYLAPVFRGGDASRPEAGAISESIVDGDHQQAAPIIEAIETVAGRHDDVLVGATTRLNSCSHYVDFLGHISNGEMFSGVADAAVATGLFYRDFDFEAD